MNENGVDDPRTLWTTTELLQVLAGLMSAYYAMPWPFRFLLRPWRDALVAVGVVLAGDQVMQAAIRDGLVDSIMRDYGDAT